MKTKKQEFKTLTFKVDPTRGFASMAFSMQAPKGWKFSKMNRKFDKAVITYVRNKK